MVYNDFSDMNSVSGGPIIMGDYTASVFQHDSSGFYNWQQDNLPVIDLQERDTFLFKMMGAPTSSVEGMTFIVSSQAGPLGTNIFTEVDDVIARIPKRLTFPVLVELCTYASLSSLDLNGITTEGAGALRIINRNAGYSASSSITTIAATEKFFGNIAKKTPSTIVSLDSWDTIVNASSHAVSTGCYSSVAWQRYKKGYVTKGASMSKDNATDFIHLNIQDFDETGLIDSAAPFATTAATFNVPYGHTFDKTVSGFDPHPKTKSGRGSALYHSADDPVPGVSIRPSIDTGKADNNHFTMLYASWFTDVKITNCSGKIQLENILVDGASGTALTLEHVTNHGFSIKNSSIELKNCTSMRNNITGFDIENSNIKITESFLAARNYNINTVDHISRKHDDGGDSVLPSDALDSYGSNGIGVRAKNSTLYFEVNSTLSKSGNYIKAAFANGTGWSLSNTSIIGGRAGTVGNYSGNSLAHLTALYNNYNGFTLNNSIIDWIGALDASKNGQNGIEAFNSKIRGHIFAIEDNQRSGIMANLTHILYGSQLEFVPTAADTLERGQFSFTNNGQNLTILNNSSFKPDLATAAQDNKTVTTLDNHFGVWTASSTHHGNSVELNPQHVGVNPEIMKYALLKGNIPGILVSQNSHAEILNLNYMTPALMMYGQGALGGEPDEVAHMGIYGHAVLANNNSNVTLRGLSSSTKQFTTITSDFYGALTSNYVSPNDFFHLRATWGKSAVCAKGNSSVRITGPTKISRLGIALHAEDNSTIETVPPEYPFGDGSVVDGSFYSTSGSQTQTKLELHATRSCIVVNNKSHWKAEHLGTTQDPHPNPINAEYNSWTNYMDDSVVDDGYIKFYPQPFTTEYYNAGDIVASMFLEDDAGASVFGIDDGEAFDKSLGGMCVRAVGDSSVYITECNFKPTAGSASVSGSVYNIQGASCDRPHIWNIADNSRIVANRLTLSGIDPVNDTPVTGLVQLYHGPSGTWDYSAIAGTTHSIAGRNLFLDDYGQNGRCASGGITIPASISQKNFGYFRLMMGTVGYVGSLVVSAYTGMEIGENLNSSGMAPQLIAQGYSPSAIFPQGSELAGYMANDEAIGHLVRGTAHPDYHADYDGTIYNGGRTTFSHSFAWGPTYLADRFLSPGGATRNFFDSQSMRLFANAAHISQPHLALISVIKLGNYYYSDEAEQHGDSAAAGVRSLMRFDLRRLT